MQRVAVHARAARENNTRAEWRSVGGDISDLPFVRLRVVVPEQSRAEQSRADLHMRLAVCGGLFSEESKAERGRQGKSEWETAGRRR